MKLKYLWLWFFPLLFLPNLGQSIQTTNGTIELSDFLIFPYVVLLVFALPSGKKLNIGRITPILGLFVLWASISTITMPARYHYYIGDGPLTFSLLKIAKLCVYGMAGILTARALADEHSRRSFDWSLLAAGVVTGISLFTLGAGHGVKASTYTGQTYSETNGISVMVAILVCYLAARYLTKAGTSRWRQIMPIGFVIIAAGFFLSDGRGGWIAALAGFFYLFIRLGFRRQVITFAIGAAIVVGFFYSTQPDFQRQVDMTIFPQRFPNTTGIGGVDNGARFATWAEEAPKLLDDPILGRGFYHRGGNSGLWTTGSHNFFIQMFLETGLVGGLLVIAALVAIWRQATAMAVSARLADLPYKAALVAAIAGGMSGEYYYGGIILLTLFAVYAPLGGLPREEAITEVESVPGHLKHALNAVESA